MKHIILLLFAIFNTFLTFGQIIATGNYKLYNNYSGVDYVIVFNGIDSNTSLSYTGAYESSVSWYKFSNLSTPITTQEYNNNVEDMTGYLLVIDGDTKISIWVIDYQNYLPDFRVLNVENNPAEQCSEVNLFLQADIWPMEYQSFNKTTNMPSIMYPLERFFNVSYDNIEWAGDDWKPKEEKIEIYLPQEYITVSAPLVETHFTISGDQFASDLGFNTLPSIQSELYTPVAVECHILALTATREQLNEGDRPSSTDVKEASSPIEITFEAKANDPIARYFNWQITRDDVQIVSRADRNHSYTFKDAGIYKVVLTANNQYCSSSDSILIRVNSSNLQVPYAFSPNGDGKNDEFRVAYTSLTDFKCWIFSRWGKQIYYWTDPQKGWDGTINGTPAKPGGYIYIIEATGADIDEYTKKPVRYRKKGIVNLLR